MKILRIGEETWQQIQRYHLGNHEKISFLFANTIQRGNNHIVIVSGEPILLGDDCYVSSGTTQVKLYKDVQAGVLTQFLTSDCNTLINIHNHPFSQAGTTFSSQDDRDDLAQDITLRKKIHLLTQGMDGFQPRPLFNVALVFDQSTFDARLIDSRKKNRFQAIDHVQRIGEKLAVSISNSRRKTSRRPIDPTTVRQDFIGQEPLEWLAQAHIGLCGAGGLGSILAEGLLRLGVRRMTAIDDDTAEASNLNRLQSARKSQVGQPKVNMLAKNLKAMEPTLVFKGIKASMKSTEAIEALTACDVIFGGVDNSFARSILNHLSVQYLIPYFDAGVEIQENPVNFRYRLFNVTPGVTACMQCTPFLVLDQQQIVSELLNPELQNEFRHRGYISDRTEVKSPSVYPLNLSASGACLLEFVNYLADVKPFGAVVFDDYQQNKHERCDRVNFPLNRPQEDCPCSFYRGKGDSAELPFQQSVSPKRFLEQYQHLNVVEPIE